MAWYFRKTLRGMPVPEATEVVLGGTLTAGTPVIGEKAAGGKVVTFVTGAYASPLGVLLTGGIEDETAQMIPALPDVVFEAPVRQSVAVPVQWGLYDIHSSGAVDGSDTTNPKVMVVGPGGDGLYTTTCEVVALGFGAEYTALEADIDATAAEITEHAGRMFKKTVTLTSAAAATPVEILADAEVGAAKSAYIWGAILKVDGATAWTDSSGTIVRIKDTAGSPVTMVSYAKAQLTGNAVLVFGSTGVTLADPVAEGTGGTATKGLQVDADSDFDAGSDIKLTVFGCIM